MNLDADSFQAMEVRGGGDETAGTTSPSSCTHTTTMRSRVSSGPTDMVSGPSRRSELAGPSLRLRMNLIDGIKHLPVRFTPSPAEG